MNESQNNTNYRRKRRIPFNLISEILKISAAIIFFVGFVLGMFEGTVTDGYLTRVPLRIAIIYWSISFIAGIIILGLSEIIRLLDEKSDM
ncbi:MAG: hypothetical protein MJ091_02475 [Clostridia bacterium]|nr:hypothetical protein [Clostridia bacterium]